MATLVELRDSGVLVVIDPLEPDELPWRTLYGTDAFINWLDIVLPGLVHDPMYADVSPLEQVFALFAEYVSGDVFLNDRRFKKLRCTPDHYIWELKTEDVRIFGWAPEKDVFICCFGDSADQIKLQNGYGRYIALTAHARNELNLDEPKSVISEEPSDVISNKA